ncbi:MAG: hypothetical protein ACRDH5_08035, partial [bacterium]
LGEMLVGADNDDWYFVNEIVGAVGNPYTVTVCPTIPKQAGWETGLELKSKRTFNAPIPTNVVGLGLVKAILERQVNSQFPLTDIGASHNGGCDTLPVDGSLNGGDPLFTERVFIHVSRDNADGLYDLTVA